MVTMQFALEKMALRKHWSLLATLVAVLLAASLSGTSVEGMPTSRYLNVGYYSKTACENVEDIVRAEVKKEFKTNPSIVALLLRIYFHDCFADGKCDASLLITKNIVETVPTELDSAANEGIRGLAFIDSLKETVVGACDRNGDIVSCADIIALATRDAVALASKRAPYQIKTGRLDGKVSLMKNADTLPNPRFPIAATVTRFLKEGFSPEETVILSGAHTVGQARCKFFDDRLNNFQRTGKPDPSMNKTTLASLTQLCKSSGENRVFLDQGPDSAFKVDKSYFVMLTQGNGILQSDQDLLTDPLTKDFVRPLADGSDDDFATKFEDALKKMGDLGALSSATGNIRKKCSVLNPY